MNEKSFSLLILSTEGEPLCSAEEAAEWAQVALPLVERLREEGLLVCEGAFVGRNEIHRIARIGRVARDLEIDPVGAAVIVDLADEIERLRQRLAAMGLY